MQPRSQLLLTACSCLLLATSACAHTSADTDSGAGHVEQGPRGPTYTIHAVVEPDESMAPGEMAAKTGPGYEIAEGEDPGFPELHVWAPPTMDSVPTNIQIARGLAEVCGISEVSAFFAQDSAELEPGAQTGLKALADCFTTGPMKGHRLAITGHTDPQGKAQDNVELGRARANSVAKYLQTVGLSGGEMATASAGEAEAHPDKPELWPTDRKVVLDVDVSDAEPPADASE